MTWPGPTGSEETSVPRLVGLTVSSARVLAREAGLTLGAGDPDGPPLSAFTWPGVYIVTAQRPAPGVAMRRRGTVVVEFMPGPPDGAGDREPRRPLPIADSLGADLAGENTDPAGGISR